MTQGELAPAIKRRPDEDSLAAAIDSLVCGVWENRPVEGDKVCSKAARYLSSATLPRCSRACERKAIAVKDSDSSSGSLGREANIDAQKFHRLEAESAPPRILLRGSSLRYR
jgi:hypothetical protein